MKTTYFYMLMFEVDGVLAGVHNKNSTQPQHVEFPLKHSTAFP